MAGNVRQDNVQVNLQILGKQAANELEVLSAKTRTLEADMKGLKRGTQEYKDKQNELKTATDQLKKKMEEVGPAGMSIRQLELYSKNLNREIKDLVPNSQAFIDKTKELRDVDARLANVRKQAKGVKEEVDKGGGSFTDFVKKSALVAGAVAAFTALWGAAKQFGAEVIAITGKFQRFEAVLTNTLGSRSEANKSLNMITKFAAETPFQVDELTDSFIRLTNSGFKPTQSEMTKLGDLASSQGKSFMQLTEAIIDSQTGEFERLKEFGIRAQKSGDQVKFTFKGVQTQTDFTAESIRKYVLGLGDLQGVAGGMAAISKTLEGQISNNADAYDRFLNNIGIRFNNVISGSLRMVGVFLSDMNKIVEQAPGTDLVNSLKEQRQEMAGVQAGLNAELEVLKKGNLSQEQRKILIDQINQKYKEHLPRLLTEKDTISDINTVQKQANELLLKNILLKIKEIEIAEKMTRVRELEKKNLEDNKQVVNLKAEQEKGLTPQQRANMMGRGVIIANVEKGQETVIKDINRRIQERQKEIESITKSLSELSEVDQKLVSQFAAALDGEEINAPEKAATKLTKAQLSQIQLFRQLVDATRDEKTALDDKETKKLADAIKKNRDKLDKEYFDLVTSFSKIKEETAKFDAEQAQASKTRDQQELDQIAAKYDAVIEKVKDHKTKLDNIEGITVEERKLREKQFADEIISLETLRNNEVEAKAAEHAARIRREKAEVEDAILGIDQTATAQQIQAVEKRYTELIAKAKKYGLDYKALEDKLVQEVKDINARAAAAEKVKQAEATRDPAQIIAAKLAQLDVERNIEIAHFTGTEEQKKQIWDSYQAQKDQISEQYANKELQRIQAMADKYGQRAGQMADIYFGFQALQVQQDLNNAEKGKKTRLQKLDEEFKTGKMSKERYERQKTEIEETENKKIKEIKIKQAKLEKSHAIAQGIIQTTLAVIQNGVITPEAILAGILGGIGVAKIAATPIPEFKFGNVVRMVGNKLVSVYKKYANGGSINPIAGVPDAGQLHSNGGIKMVDGATGQMLGEWEKGEPYMILSRNTYANNKDVIDQLINTSLYRNGAPINRKYEAGGIYAADGAVTSTPPSNNGASSTTTDGFTLLALKLDGVKDSIDNMRLNLKVYNVLTEVQDGLNTLQKIKDDAAA